MNRLKADLPGGGLNRSEYGINLTHYRMRKFYFTPERTNFAYAFLVLLATWNQGFISVPLAEGEK